MAAEARVLVVANRTAESPELLDALRTRTMQGPCSFTLVIPSTPHGLGWAADTHSGSEEAERHRAPAKDAVDPCSVSSSLLLELLAPVFLEPSGNVLGLPLLFVSPAPVEDRLG